MRKKRKDALTEKSTKLELRSWNIFLHPLSFSLSHLPICPSSYDIAPCLSPPTLKALQPLGFTCGPIHGLFHMWISSVAFSPSSCLAKWPPFFSLPPSVACKQSAAVLEVFCCRGQVFIGESRQSAAQGASSSKWDFVCSAPAALG